MSPSRFRPVWNLRASLHVAAATSALAVLAFGCADGSEGERPQRPEERMGRAIQAVVGGSPSGTARDAVVVLARYEGGVRRGLCTATLVAPNLALSARHCVSTVDGGAGCAPDGSAVAGAALATDAAPADLAVFVASAGVAPDSTSPAAASARGARLVVDASAKTICNRDIAFVVLDRALGAPIAPIRLGPPTDRDDLTAVGFGVTEAGALAASRRERGNVAFLGLGPRLYPESDRYGLGTAELVVGESVCAGDSGGPLLAASGAVVGVASRVGNGLARDPSNLASTCVGATTHAVYTQLGAHAPLVTRAFEEAGHLPWLEGERPPEDPAAAGEVATLHGRSARDVLTAAAGEDGPATKTLSGAQLGEDEAPEASAAGCSASPRAPEDAVSEAFGATSLVLLLARLTRAAPRRASRRSRARWGVRPAT